MYSHPVVAVRQDSDIYALSDLVTAGLGAAFSKSDNRGLEKELSEVFAEMRQDGTLREIIGRYFSDPDRFLEDVPYEE